MIRKPGDTRKENRLFREFAFQNRRLTRAMDKAKKHIRLANALVIIMNDALNEMHRINGELKKYDQEDEP